jgi:hypothetical protein
LNIMRRLSSRSCTDVASVIDDCRAAAKQSGGGGGGAAAARRRRGSWVTASSLIARRQWAYYRSFVPRAAAQTLATLPPGAATAAAANAELLAVRRAAAAVLVVDVTGFTRLCDRLQPLGQEGIDALTEGIGRIFDVLLGHIGAWGGDVVRFAGDAIIVMWEAAPPPPAAGGGGGEDGTAAEAEEEAAEEAAAAALSRAIDCALELEAAHGLFECAIPDPGGGGIGTGGGGSGPPLADQIGRHLAAAAAALGAAASGDRPVGPADEDVRARLRGVPGLRCAGDGDAARLAARCTLRCVRAGEAVRADPAAAAYVVHAGEFRVPAGGGGGGGDFDLAREGDVIGDVRLWAADWPAAEAGPGPAGPAGADDGAGCAVAASGADEGCAVATRSGVLIRLPPPATLRALLPRLARGGGGGGTDTDFEADAPAGGGVGGRVQLRLHQVD